MKKQQEKCTIWCFRARSWTCPSPTAGNRFAPYWRPSRTGISLWAISRGRCLWAQHNHRRWDPKRSISPRLLSPDAPLVCYAVATSLLWWTGSNRQWTL